MKTIILALALIAVISPILAAQSKVLIVFAHQEPQSFCASVRNRVFQTLVMKGHDVRVSNLVQMNMILSVDRTDFTEAFDPTYFHPQLEQLAANKKNRATFSKELRFEHDKVEWADTLLLVFPYYVMYLPSIIKSWMERVFSYGFAYGEGHSLKGKKVMMMYTTGADQEYLKNIEIQFWETVNGVFNFMGMTMYKPFCAYGVAHKSADERKAYLDEADAIAADLDNRAPYVSTLLDS